MLKRAMADLREFMGKWWFAVVTLVCVQAAVAKNRLDGWQTVQAAMIAIAFCLVGLAVLRLAYFLTSRDARNRGG